MDSKTLLDYALFQLTPTRTRCDLVVFSGKKSEKVASGLVEPFIAHLRYAKDHVPKGGYSITLRPPAKADDISWFTKATFQRFVRFVSTPEILERIIRIEREIFQIDSSIQSTEVPRLEGTRHSGEESSPVANGNIRKAHSSSKSTIEEDHEAAPRENSRVHLKRVMDTRKALLQKEQAMAYARAVVAGYGIDTIDDLVCFADAFGASRLRDACIGFKELYRKKHSDNQWIDELAAVKTCPVTELSYVGASGIVLMPDSINGNAVTLSDSTKENNVAGTEKPQNGQQQMAWMNGIPPYVYNFRGPIQQIPAYYPYYSPPGHAGWAPPRGYRRKEKSPDENGTDSSKEDGESESGSGTESDEANELDKNKKKGSKKVVIRNINYITSRGNHGESDQSRGDFSKNGEAIVSPEKRELSKALKNGLNGYAEEEDENGGGKTSNSWDAFQNLLLTRDKYDSSELTKHHPGEDHCATKISIVGHLRKSKGGDNDDDSVIVAQREGSNGGQRSSVNFFNGEDFRLTERIVLSGENVIFSEQMNSPDFSTGRKIVENGKEEDWFIVDRAKNLSHETGVFHKDTSKGASPVDDSFIIDSRHTYSSNWTTDVNMDGDVDATRPGKGRTPDVAGPAEPDELCMALVRESRESGASWAPEMDYRVEISFDGAGKRSPAGESNGRGDGKDHPLGNNGKSANGKKIAGPMSRSLPGSLARRGKVGPVSKSKKVSPEMAHKYKLMKEEEERKRMEELVIQRQKRIAERTAAGGLTSAACKKLPGGNKSTPRKPDKNRSPSMVKK